MIRSRSQSWGVFATPLLALATLACGSSDGVSPENSRETGVPEIDAGSDTGNEQDSGTTTDAGPTPLAVNGCTAAAFVEATEVTPTIFIGRDGLVFTPKCLTVDAGTTVRWEGSLTAHPIAPGNTEDPQAGSPDNPIRQTASGNSVEFTFPTPGTFAYYCVLHSFGPGNVMAGAVFVR